MKRATGWASIVLGAVMAVLGLALMVMLGPDSRITTGPHAIETDGSVVVTAPRVITWTGLQIDVLVELPAQKPVFVGLGNTVDVQSLVGKTQRLEITEFGTPWKPTIKKRAGRPVVQGAPTSLDWWYADSAGLGGASISIDLPDEPVSLAVVSVGASNLSGLQVTLAYGIKGGFAKGAGLLLLGIGLVLGGLVLRRSARLDDEDEDQYGDDAGEPGDEDGAVVYLIVDEDGVEHELTAAEVEAGGYEIVEEDASEPDPVPDPTPVPDPPAESAREPAPESASEPAAAGTGGPVVYVFVDEDGIEHEVSEDELGDFEIVDDEEAPEDGRPEDGTPEDGTPEDGGQKR